MPWYRSVWFGWVSVGLLVLADLFVALPMLALETMATDGCSSSGPQSPICSGSVQAVVFLGPLVLGFAALVLAVVMAVRRGARSWIGHLAAWVLTVGGIVGGLAITAFAVG